MKESVVYQDIVRSSQVTFALMQLEGRVGKLSRKVKQQIEGLAAAQLKALGLALSDFKTKSELNEWLTRHAATH